jgi:hypothetical protein
MKLLLGAGVLILLFSIPAFGQLYGPTVGGGSSLNNGQSLNGLAGINSSGYRGPTATSETQFHTMISSGSQTEFIPSVYVPFDQAVAEGRAALAAKPKTLAEVALENRAAKKVKSEVAVIQNDDGRVVRQTQ